MKSFKYTYNVLSNTPKINEIAKKELFDNIFLYKLKGDDKLIEIDDYNQEDILRLKNGGIPVSGLIYTFIYQGEYSYNDKNYKTKFPIMLCTKINEKYIEGIDLMLMEERVKVVFLEAYYLMFKSIFENIEEKTENKILALNEKFIMLIKSGKLGIFFNEIYKITKVDISLCYRRYNINQIKDLRMIEMNKWQYIPFFKNIYSLDGISLKDLYNKKINK